VTRDNRRRHDVPTGRPPGAPKGNVNAVRSGAHGASSVASRKAFAALMREARSLLRELADD
jgi:hypothetical protein